METLLFKLGLILFVVGLLTGFAIPVLKNPRNDMFLALLGLL